MTDSQIIVLFWERNEDAIKETDRAYGRKLYPSLHPRSRRFCGSRMAQVNLPRPSEAPIP